MRFLLPPVLLATLSLPAPAQAAKPKPPRVPWDSAWRLAPEESDRVEALIEEHVKGLNFAAKLLWKRKLQSACRVYPNLDLLLGQGFSVTFGKELPADTPTDGSRGSWKRSDGEVFQLSMRQEDGRITQTLQGDGYALVYTYSLAPDAQTLTLQALYSSPKLEKPFGYKLTYRRAD